MVWHHNLSKGVICRGRVELCGYGFALKQCIFLHISPMLKKKKSVTKKGDFEPIIRCGNEIRGRFTETCIGRRRVL